MKTITHENLEIEDFTEWYAQLHKTHSGIMGAEWDKEAKVLKIFYDDTATELTEAELGRMKIPAILRFRKKVISPKLDSATVVSATENELIVETFDAESVRKEIKSKLSEFEEAS